MHVLSEGGAASTNRCNLPGSQSGAIAEQGQRVRLLFPSPRQSRMHPEQINEPSSSPANKREKAEGFDGSPGSKDSQQNQPAVAGGDIPTGSRLEDVDKAWCRCPVDAPTVVVARVDHVHCCCSTAAAPAFQRRCPRRGSACSRSGHGSVCRGRRWCCCRWCCCCFWFCGWRLLLWWWSHCADASSCESLARQHAASLDRAVRDGACSNRSSSSSSNSISTATAGKIVDVVKRSSRRQRQTSSGESSNVGKSSDKQQIVVRPTGVTCDHHEAMHRHLHLILLGQKDEPHATTSGSLGERSDKGSTSGEELGQQHQPKAQPTQENTRRGGGAGTNQGAGTDKVRQRHDKPHPITSPRDVHGKPMQDHETARLLMTGSLQPAGGLWGYASCIEHSSARRTVILCSSKKETTTRTTTANITRQRTTTTTTTTAPPKDDKQKNHLRRH